jgi:hypothetical protein
VKDIDPYPEDLPDPRESGFLAGCEYRESPKSVRPLRYGAFREAWPFIPSGRVAHREVNSL